jgi:hypothetical protein
MKDWTKSKVLGILKVSINVEEPEKPPLHSQMGTARCILLFSSHLINSASIHILYPYLKACKPGLADTALLLHPDVRCDRLQAEQTVYKVVSSKRSLQLVDIKTPQLVSQRNLVDELLILKMFFQNQSSVSR